MDSHFHSPFAYSADAIILTETHIYKQEKVRKGLPMTLMGCVGILGAGALILMKDKELNLANDDKNVKGWVFQKCKVLLDEINSSIFHLSRKNKRINVKGTNGIQTISNGCIDA